MSKRKKLAVDALKMQTLTSGMRGPQKKRISLEKPSVGLSKKQSTPKRQKDLNLTARYGF